MEPRGRGTWRAASSAQPEALVQLEGLKHGPPMLVGGLTCELVQQVRGENAGKGLVTHGMCLRVRMPGQVRLWVQASELSRAEKGAPERQTRWFSGLHHFRTERGAQF